MITEEDISGIPGIVIEDNIYLLADSMEVALSFDPIVDIYVDGDFCPYCGAPCMPRRFWRHCGPGDWEYRTYACDTVAAIRPTEQRRYLLLAVSKPTSSCREYISLVTAKDEDTI